MKAHPLVVLGLMGCNIALGGGPSDKTQRYKFKSTKETAAKLEGLPGMTCHPEQEAVAKRRGGWSGPCWDPPGGVDAIPQAHLKPGMQSIKPADFTEMDPRAIYWFDAPREATPRDDGVMMVPTGDPNDPLTQYSAYGTQGFATPTLPDVRGRSLTDALAAFDAMDLPFVVAVRWSDCEGANDTICSAGSAGLGNGYVQLTAAMRIRHRGTDKEQRQIPANLEGRPTNEVIAELEKIGFTNIVVVEKDLPCERGLVCSTYRPGWHPTNQKIELEVRRAKK